LGATLSQAVKGVVTTSKAAIGNATNKTASSIGSGSDLTIIIIIVLLICAGLFLSNEES
jgi:hypothetical protein